MQKIRVWSLGWEEHLEKEMATHSRILAWEIAQTEDPGRVQSIVLQRVRHAWVAEPVCTIIANCDFGQLLWVFSSHFI